VWDEHDISSGQTHEMMSLKEDIAAWLGPPSLFIRVDAGNVLEKAQFFLLVHFFLAFSELVFISREYQN
jgi:hypothetical protein